MNELDKVIKPALQIIEFIFDKKNLEKSNLAARTKVLVDKGRVQVLMPSYAEFVDRGRKAGKFPPIKSILKWIREKNIKVPNAYTLEQFAFLIGRKIEKKGTKGKFFLEEMANRLTELVFDYTNKIINDKINKI